MNQHTGKKDWILLLACLGLGVLAERSFFYGTIGVSYLMFITVFYLVFFLRFQFLFKHRRIGSLLMVGIWLMAGSYLFYDHTFFYYINLVFIPILMFFQMILLTSPSKLNWSKLSFMRLVTGKFIDLMKYFAHYVRFIVRRLLHRKTRRSTIRRVFVGFLFSIPILIITLWLLSQVDGSFRAWLTDIPIFTGSFNLFGIFISLGIILFAFFVIFSVFQVVGRRTKRDILIKEDFRRSAWDGIVVATILIVLNAVYILFLSFEIPHFFAGEMGTRMGYMTLLLAVISNWILLVLFLKRVTTEQRNLQIMLKILYSALIIITGLLIFALIDRVRIYEGVHGFTLDRLLIYVFMLFLFVVFAYTFIRVWVENLSMLHFYLIAGLLFYMMLQVINIEGIVVENNVERYKETGEVDIEYMSQLGAEGIKGLIMLYEYNPENLELQQILLQTKESMEMTDENWQGFNFVREEAKQLLDEIDIKSDLEVEIHGS